MKEFREELTRCKDYGKILDTIEETLQDATLEVDRVSENELMVKNAEKSKVDSLIQSLPIPKLERLLLIKVKEAKNIIYIRKKIK